MASWNSGAEIMFGYSAREMVGRSILDLIPPDGHAEEQDILEQIRRGRSVQHLETVRRTKDGRLIHVSVTCSPIRDARGKIIGASKSARDITERVQAEAVPLLLHAIPFNSINSEGIFNDYLSSRPKAAIPQARDRTPKGPAAGIAPTPSGCTDIAMICGLGLGRGEQNMKDNVNGIA
jgi:PAS domain S-box-containing protein